MVSFQQLQGVNTGVTSGQAAQLQALQTALAAKARKDAIGKQILGSLANTVLSTGLEAGSDFLQRKAERDKNKSFAEGLLGVVGDEEETLAPGEGLQLESQSITPEQKLDFKKGEVIPTLKAGLQATAKPQDPRPSPRLDALKEAAATGKISPEEFTQLATLAGFTPQAKANLIDLQAKQLGVDTSRKELQEKEEEFTAKQAIDPVTGQTIRIASKQAALDLARAQKEKALKSGLTKDLKKEEMETAARDFDAAYSSYIEDSKAIIKKFGANKVRQASIALAEGGAPTNELQAQLAALQVDQQQLGFEYALLKNKGNARALSDADLERLSKAIPDVVNNDAKTFNLIDVRLRRRLEGDFSIPFTSKKGGIKSVKQFKQSAPKAPANLQSIDFGGL